MKREKIKNIIFIILTILITTIVGAIIIIRGQLLYFSKLESVEKDMYIIAILVWDFLIAGSIIKIYFNKKKKSR